MAIFECVWLVTHLSLIAYWWRNGHPLRWLTLMTFMDSLVAPHSRVWFCFMLVRLSESSWLVYIWTSLSSTIFFFMDGSLFVTNSQYLRGPFGHSRGHSLNMWVSYFLWKTWVRFCGLFECFYHSYVAWIILIFGRSYSSMIYILAWRIYHPFDWMILFFSRRLYRLILISLFCTK